MKKAFAGGVAAVALFTGTAVHAGSIYAGFDMTVSVDGVQDGDFSPVFGTEPQTDVFNWASTFDDPDGDWSFGDGYDVTLRLDDPSRRVFNLNFGFVNMTDETHTYQIAVNAPVDGILNTFILGTVSGSVNDASQNGFAELTNPGGTPGFQGMIDGSNAMSLLDPVTATYNGAPGGGAVFNDSMGVPPGSLPGPPLDSDFGIIISFTLTPGDTASFTSSFLVQPAPGVLAFFGLAFAVGGRRRRR